MHATLRSVSAGAGMHATSRALPARSRAPTDMSAQLECRLEWGGSRLRPEATGFGAVFFARELLEDQGDSLAGKRCLVSGSG